MCLIAFAWQRHAAFPLIFAGNRDEFLSRPTAVAQWWTSRPDVLGGQDLEAGGTWCGVTRSGRLAALTNYRAPSERNSAAPSRGRLVSGFLESPSPATDFLAALASEKSRYNGFNLLVGEALGTPERRLWIDSNRTRSMPHALPGGLYAVSNAELDTPWPKVIAAKSELERIVDRPRTDPAALTAALFALLSRAEPAPDALLPSTGVPFETERSLSAAFVRMPGYGTRASTVILVDSSGWVHFSERTFDPDTGVSDRQFEPFCAGSTVA